MTTVPEEKAGSEAASTDDPTGKKKGEDEPETSTSSSSSRDQCFADPAILVVGGISKMDFRYTKDELMKLRKAPLSLVRPDFLDSAYFNNGVWDPEPWHFNNKASDSTGDGPAEPDNHKRRPGDPRERIRKEQDGIVLSPQRRSFNSGCFVPVREPLRTNRPHSPLGGGKSDPPHISHREIGGSGAGGGQSGRRIGSGRILPWDFQEKSDVDNDFGYRRERRDTDRDERFERRSFGRDFDLSSKDKDRHISRNNSGSNGRFSTRRISNESKEEEPEWFSSGPMSQTDTIELRGFDDSEKVSNKKKGSNQKASKKKNKELSELKEQKDHHLHKPNHKEGDGSEESSDKKSDNKGKSSPPPKEPIGVIEENQMGEKESMGDGPHIGVNDDTSFNLEDILKADSIPGISGLLSNGVEGGDGVGSRFSRWFQREKSPPTKQPEPARNASLQDQDHHHLIKNLLGDSFGEPSVTIPQPGDSESYFAPISPAASSVQHNQPQQQKTMNLMEMLARSKQRSMHPTEMGPPPGKIVSLEELEATFIQGIDGPKHQTKQEDENAFKRLFSNANMNHVQQQKPMSIMDMLAHSQQQDEAARIASQRMATGSGHQHLADMTYKLQQVQNQVQQQQQKQAQFEMLTKLVNQLNPQARASPLPDVSMNYELLSRPEAQAILQGLTRGDITPQHLYQQLANPAMQPRHRDMLLTILKMQVGLQQSASPIPQHHLYQQKLRVSPLQPNPVHQRIPSPRELQVHTQNIMQRALIKKKLEEQEENFRKKQAQQRGTSPAKTASPTPLAFTPTAVLRKMTAEKDDGSKENKGDPNKVPQGRPLTGMRSAQPQPTGQTQQPQQQVNAQQQSQTWNQFPQQLKQPAGRPIVKSNHPTSYHQPAAQTQQQEQYFAQQRLLQQQQQRKSQQQQFGGGGAGGGGNSGSGFGSQQFNQLSQQQMRAQHQNVRSQHQFTGGQPQQPQSQQPSWAQQMLQGQNYENRPVVGRGGMDGGGGGDLSPTSNQLARWFSPDLLERARKGKLPGIPPNAVAQHALSLEEVERQTTPVGHN